MRHYQNSNCLYCSNPLDKRTAVNSEVYENAVCLVCDIAKNNAVREALAVSKATNGKQEWSVKEKAWVDRKDLGIDELNAD